jgi:pectate lyase
MHEYPRRDWKPLILFSAALVWLTISSLPTQAAGTKSEGGGALEAGDRVVALVRTPVKASPDGQQVLASPLPGGQGTIEQGPQRLGGERWWLVAFDEGIAGWAREADLQIHEPGIKAFPTAEGFGAKALGGRGGRVIEVTNLEDSGPGSLRDAVDQEGPRTIVFRVGGTIKVERPIRIRDPYITIAGQTAPGDGILLRNHPANTEAPITIETHDVVIRYLRSRPGPSGVPSCCVDALGLMEGARDVIIDHVSLSWGVDEDLGASENAHDFTVQWSILSEGLRRSNHIKGDRHSRGMLISTQEGGNVSIHHNLFAHNEGRNPEVALSYGVADIVNNVLYNPNYRMIEISEANAKPRANVVGNVMRNGKNTKIDNPEINNHIVRARDVDDGAHEGFVMYVVGNLDELYRTDDAMPDEISVIEGDRRYLAAARQPAPFVATTLPERAYSDVLERAGATLPRRDMVDIRILATVRDRRGKVIDDPSQGGGWPYMASGTPPADADHDGMPDAWEHKMGLDPNDPGDRNGDVTGNGYTNLEDYLNELAGDIQVSAPRDSAELAPGLRR